MRLAQPDRTPAFRVSCRGSGSGCPEFLPTYAGIEVCPDCGLGRTIAGTAAADEQDYLDPQEVGGADRPEYFRVLFDTYCKDVMPGRALDIGCGRGEWVRLLKTRGWTAHGIDAFHDFKSDNISFFRANLDNYSPDLPYDFITLIHCFEHLADPVASLKRLEGLLKPGGRLLIIVPNFGGAWSRLLAGNWHMLRTDHHVFHYTPKSLTRIPTKLWLSRFAHEHMLPIRPFDIAVATQHVIAPQMKMQAIFIRETCVKHAAPGCA